MSKPFDATLHVLIDRHLPNWVAFLCAQAHLPVGPATLLDSDLSTTLQADRLIRVEANPPYLLHLELESSGALGMPARLLHYNVNAHHAHDLDVWSVVILLRPSANPSDLTGMLDRRIQGVVNLHFRYTTIRLWELPFEVMLRHGPGFMALAMLTDEAVRDSEQCLARIDEQLRSDSLTDKMLEDELSSIYFMMGMRYDPLAIQQLFRSAIMFLEDSSTYQLVLKKGEARGIALGEARGVLHSSRSHILRVGIKRFWPAPAEVMSKIQAISDLVILEMLLDRAVEARTWDEVIAGI